MSVGRIELPPDGLEAARICVAVTLPTGSPELIRSVGRRSAAFATALRSVGVELRAVSDTEAWRGEAHTAFLHRVRANLPVFDATSARYDAYAAALISYAVSLEVAMADLPWLKRQLIARLEVVNGRMTGRAGHAVPIAEIDDHRDLLLYARRFKDAHDAWVDAVDRCSAALLRANDADPTRDLHGWSAVSRTLDKVTKYVAPMSYLIAHPTLNTLSETLTTLGTELTVLGIGLLFVCPPAGMAALAAATVLSAAQLVVDSTRKVRHDGDHIGWTTIGIDALGAVPIGGRIGRIGATAADRLLPGAARTVSHLVPGGGLAAHEAAGGHTLARHVGRSDAELIDRAFSQSGISGASTFYDRATAERVIGGLTADKQPMIDEWLSSGRRRLVVYGRGTDNIGRYVAIGSSRVMDAAGICVVLRRDLSLRTGFRVQTAFVEP